SKHTICIFCCSTGSQQQAAGGSKVTAERVAVVVLLAAAVIAFADTCHKCQEGWEQNGPQCYYFSTDKLTWEQAREKCRRDGADLVKIESEDEDKMVEKEDRFWIGLTDSVTEGTWLWTDGTPLNKSLTFWGKGQPDNLKGENADGQDCVRMGEISRSGLKWWFDKSCTAPQKRICEKSAETGR
uniref:C-type lectin domain-containing protein n=1 Tax=Sparus aurata TaxID=8175 RepID=A0A671XI52_SPAAU